MNSLAFRCGVTLFFVLGLARLCPAEDNWPLWNSYKTYFLSPDGRIVDRDAGDRTTSEGQSYALFFSLVANDRQTFDLILNWTEKHLAQGDLGNHLPAWLWAQGADGNFAIQDANSASDADVWIAYTLAEAAEIWNEPSYRVRAKSLASQIAAHEVSMLPKLGPVLLPGPSGFQQASGSLVLNPSYMPLPVISGLGTHFPYGPWRNMAKVIPDLLMKADNKGFAMDWIEGGLEDQFLPSAGPGSRACGSYDAIRVYLWAGMIPEEMAGRQRILQAVDGMPAYLRTHALPPTCVSAEGVVIAGNGPVGFSAAVIPLLSATGQMHLANEQESRVRAEHIKASGLYGKQQHYYDQNLILFSQAWSEHRFHFDREGRLRLRWKR